MKRLLSAVIALTLLGGTAATAAPFHHSPRIGGPVHMHGAVHVFSPRPHVWIRGERFLVPHRHHIVLHDWHRHHLRRPPVGYRWVRYGDDLLLVHRRSGFVLDVRPVRF
jgi:Ni/Co efflux regulator RcnB